MAGIARNIELYNSAYRLAWKLISDLQKREQPDVARRLHNAIERQLENGGSEPLFIASDALKALDERKEPRNPQARQTAAAGSPFSTPTKVPMAMLKVLRLVRH